MPRQHLFWLIIFLALGLAAAAQGDSPPPPDPAQTSAPVHHLGSLDLTATLRGRGEAWNWFYQGARVHYEFGESRLQFSLSQRRSKFDWQISFEQPALFALPNNAFSNGVPLGLGGAYRFANVNRNAAGFFLNQAFIRIRGVAQNNDTLQLGRFQFTEGLEGSTSDPSIDWLKRNRVAGRLIGNSSWTNVTRSLDGLRFSDQLSRNNNVTFVAARVTPGVYQTIGWSDMDVDILYAAFTRELNTPKTASEFRAFASGYHDGRRVLKIDNRPLAVRQADTRNIRIGTFGGHYLLTFPIHGLGQWDLLAWGTVQTGSWGTLHQHAGAVTGEAGWQPPIKFLHPWLRAGAFMASADGNPNDGKHTTFFQLLPNDRQYARIPFYALQNVEDYTGQLLLRPSPRLWLRSEIHKVKLHGHNDLWYQGAGAFQDGSFGFFGAPSEARGGLANFIDLSADIQATSHLRFTAYFGLLSGKATITSDPRGRKAGFTYLEFVYDF